MSARVLTGKAQFVVATHSPILLTMPNSQILSFDGGAVQESCLEETSHYQITRGILENPSVYWKHLRMAAEGDDAPPNKRLQPAARRAADAPRLKRKRYADEG
jgi:hypothetical protein